MVFLVYGTATSLYCTALYFTCTVLNMLLLYSTLLYSTLLYSTLLYSTLLYSPHLYSTLVYSSILYLFCSTHIRFICTSSPTCMHCSVQCLLLVAIATDPSQRSGPTLPNKNSNIMKAIS